MIIKYNFVPGVKKNVKCKNAIFFQTLIILSFQCGSYREYFTLFLIVERDFIHVNRTEDFIFRYCRNMVLRRLLMGVSEVFLSQKPIRILGYRLGQSG